MTPLMGWHHGNFHYSLAVPVFLPTGVYDTADIDFADRSAKVLSIGKNKVAVDPTAALTWLDTTLRPRSVGRARHHVQRQERRDRLPDRRGASHRGLGQNLPHGFALGVAGYYYQQIADDSGEGADSFKRALGTDNLRARVFGIGPVATFMRQVGPVGVNAKIKFFKEFERKRRFESDVLSISLGISW